jgi:polyhydroxybutyrate depolymerase
MRWITHFDTIADRHGFAVVYPEGYDRSWNDGRGFTPAEQQGVDDVAFIHALIARMADQHTIDRSHVASTGLSNGGVMCHRLALELGNEISVIAPVAGPMPRALGGRTPPYAISVLLIHGTADCFLPIEGGRSLAARRRLLWMILSDARLPGGEVMSLSETAARWRAIDGCETETFRNLLPPTRGDPTSVEIVSSGGGLGGTVVETRIVREGGHTWPGGPRGMGLGWLGRTTRQFDAGEVIWQFVERHGYPAGARRRLGGT